LEASAPLEVFEACGASPIGVNVRAISGINETTDLDFLIKVNFDELALTHLNRVPLM
jgi:hypothetical protein